MKITEIRIGKISVPLRTPFKTALRTVASVEDVVFEIHTDTGAVGYGEAPPTGVITGDTTGAIIGAMQDHIRKTLIGREIDEFESCTRALNGCIVKNTSAKAAADMALCQHQNGHGRARADEAQMVEAKGQLAPDALFGILRTNRRTDIAQRREIAGRRRRLNARLKSHRQCRHRSTTGLSRETKTGAIDVRARLQVVEDPHGVVDAHAGKRRAEQCRSRTDLIVTRTVRLR